MNYVLGGLSIGAVLARSQGGAAQWWQAAGVTPIACYQPKGALSLPDSYINLANPGTYNAAPGVAPTFDTATGWTTAGLAYLDTGIIAGSGWTYLIKLANVASSQGAIFGAFESSRSTRLFPTYNNSVVYYGNGGEEGKTPAVYNGVVGAAGNKAYRNGVDEGITIAAWSGTTTRSIIIFGSRAASIVPFSAAATISSIWIANTTLNAAQVAAQSAAMP